MTISEINNPRNNVFRLNDYSMDNGTSSSIPRGADILAEEYALEDGKALPIDENLFVIVSRKGSALRQVIEHNLQEGYIKCHAYSPKYGDYHVPLSDVTQIFIYRKIVSVRPPIPAVTGQLFEDGMELSESQSINSKGIVVDVVKWESYFLNEGTPDQTRWIYEEYSDGSKSHTLSAEGLEKLDREFPC